MTALNQILLEDIPTLYKNYWKLGISASRRLDVGGVNKIYNHLLRVKEKNEEVKPEQEGTMVLVGDNPEGGDAIIQHICKELGIKILVLSPLLMPRFFIEHELANWCDVGEDKDLGMFDNFHNRDKIIIKYSDFYLAIASVTKDKKGNLIPVGNGTTSAYTHARKQIGLNSFYDETLLEEFGSHVWVGRKNMFNYYNVAGDFGDFVDVIPKLDPFQIGDRLTMLSGNGQTFVVDTDGKERFLSREDLYLLNLEFSEKETIWDHYSLGDFL